MTFYHTFMASRWCIEECLSSMTRPGFVSLHQRVVTVTHHVPSVWVYVPVIRSRLCDVPSFTALCLLSPVALSRDHERNGVRIKNRAERSEQTLRSVGSYFLSVSLLMRFLFLAWRPVIVKCSVIRLSVSPDQQIPGLWMRQSTTASTHTFTISP